MVEIQAINKEINIYNNVYHNLFVNADENMLNTILRNLLSNAIKFTKAKGEIHISSRIKDNFVIVDILKNQTVDFRLIHLNGDDESGLGRLDNYEIID